MKYLLIDTDVICRLKQGTDEEKVWVRRLSQSGQYLVFYGNHNLSELTNYGERDEQGNMIDPHEKERSMFHYIDELELLNQIKIVNDDEWASRTSIVVNRLFPAFKKKWPRNKFTPGLKDYRLIKKEDVDLYNWKDFAHFKQLEHFRFDYFLTFDGKLFKFCKENEKIFEKLGCKVLTLNKKHQEYLDALEILQLNIGRRDFS